MDYGLLGTGLLRRGQGWKGVKVGPAVQSGNDWKASYHCCLMYLEVYPSTLNGLFGVANVDSGTAITAGKVSK
jgi:hypothetical protein